MTELLTQMTDLLEQARKQGIADALQALKDWRDEIADDYSGSEYLGGVDDAVITIEQM